MGKLSEDLETNILVRLPVRSLLRFKCVCKRWNSMISSSRFAKIQLERAMERNFNFPSCQRLLLATIPPRSVDFELLSKSDENDDKSSMPLEGGPMKDEEDYEILGSCNGLVLFLDDSEMVLWNPTTRKTAFVPKTTNSFPDDNSFDGFGYDPLTDDYKIIKGTSLAASNDTKETVIDIFSLKEKSWKTIREGSCSVRGSGTYLAGSLHWLLRKNDSNKYTKIISFDLTEEKFQEVLALPDDSQSIELDGLQVSGGKLYIYHGSSWGLVFEAWMMDEYGVSSSWTKVCSVSSDKLPSSKYWLNPLAFTSDGKVVFDLAGWEIDIFDPKENSYKSFEFPNESDYFSSAVIYLESLVSPS